VFYVIMTIVSLLIIMSINRKKAFSGIKILFPIAFILIHSLYVIPLPLRTLIDPVYTIVNDGSSPELLNFIDYLAFALYFSSLFNVFFAISFVVFAQKFSKKMLKKKYARINSSFWIIYMIFFLISIGILVKFAQDSGGLIGLILSGYHITEKFVGHSQYAIAFEWIGVLTILLFAVASVRKEKILFLVSVVMIFIVTISFLIMGRRAVIVVLGISLLFIYHENIKRITLPMFLGILFVGFIGLNIVGLLRGDSYSDLTSLTDTVSTKINSQANDGTLENGLFYTLTNGNFVIPYETFPQVIKGFGSFYPPGLGTYTIGSLLLLVPNFIWPDRPLPLSNWYIDTFYGNAPMNEGRQFYILSSFYMDFGPLGILFTSILLGIFFAWLSRISLLWSNSPVLLTGIALVLGNILNIIANDIFGWGVAFVKTVFIPLLVISLVSRISLNKRSQK